MEGIAVDLVGYAGGLIIAMALFPQVLQTWRTKSAKDISLLWTVIYLIGLITMVVYGFLIANTVIIVTISIEANLLFILLIMKLVYR